MEPLISVCIPVFGTEPLLERCLLSVADQDFKAMEVIVVSDASTGKNEKGWKAEKITKSVLKKRKIPYKFLEHNVNLGLVETRRDAITYSQGKYIFIIDSDDFLHDNQALSKLYAIAEDHDADIVNSRCTVWSKLPEERQEAINQYYKQMNQILPGLLEGHDIFRSFTIEKTHLGFLWAKLIRRDLFQKAMDTIPCTFCVMGEDFLIYFFLSLFAKRYYGIEERYYSYSIDSGVSSNTYIKSLEQWHKNCTASSVFNVIFDYISNHYDDFTPEERNAVRQYSNIFLKNNLLSLKNRIPPDLKPEAYEMLCEMWGESYVKAIEELTK